MIESIQFKNFKVLRDATLPLGRCTVIVGPNGSGKSTVLDALRTWESPKRVASGMVGGGMGGGGFSGKQHAQPGNFRRLLSLGAAEEKEATVEVMFSLGPPNRGTRFGWTWREGAQPSIHKEPLPENPRIVVYSFDAHAIAEPAQVDQKSELAENGAGLAAVLDRLRDTAPERFHAISEQLGEWLPEFDAILFEPTAGKKAIALRTREGRYTIPAFDLSHGTLIALALLTLAYLPDPPSLIGLEEPDRGVHPRLLRHVQDAIYRLSDPESHGEKRPPVQVIATTHSPYFLDLFKDHPEEIVVADKTGLEATFRRVSDDEHLKEILGGAPLGEVWYSGVLGGVPAKS